MWDNHDSGPGRRGRPGRTPAFALSIERPGRRSMRGLRGRHEQPDAEAFGRPEAEGLRRHAREHRRERGPHQVRRGAVREAVLRALGEEPMHGYQLMQSFAERTGGRWRPSAGSIYPTLQQLEDEGLVAADPIDGRRVYRLTDAGRAAIADLPVGRPFPGRGDQSRDLRGLSREVGMAALQVSRMGSPAAVEAAASILTAVRRDLYRLLADDPAGDATADGTAPADETRGDDPATADPVSIDAASGDDAPTTAS